MAQTSHISLPIFSSRRASYRFPLSRMELLSRIPSGAGQMSAQYRPAAGPMECACKPRWHIDGDRDRTMCLIFVLGINASLHSIRDDTGQCLKFRLRANPHSQLSPPPSPSLRESHEEHFSPILSNLSPSDSVLLPTREVPSYLDKALAALGLHVEARTSFITYVCTHPATG
jgi:hypothetical protein